ncbi:MAG: acyl CoA:acetate/3-ketoacid CoA transferase [Gammaproteobacteria bacterium]|nr:acyl CoA:acetate/3-ketoacid CoA transferase [Gammaproteobacteria bacterium]MCB1904092.1 acyl CoA:acetate/3-ketoacid CoA transferase [Gammaproteobacteria bacterium]
MKSKIVTAEEAVALVHDENTICCNGFVQSGIPEALLEALEKRYLETGHPKNLRLFAAAGQADGKERGLNRFGHEGMLRKVVSGNWGRMPKVAKLALDNKVFAYNLPQGVICQLYRTLASGKPGFFSKVGLHTFVDPRLEGGRVNEGTTKDIVKLVEVEGEEWLFYTVGTVDVAFIRGTTADPSGNITMERESLTLDNLAQAMAAKNCHGIVIAQVERIAEQGSLNPRDVRVPGMLVDCVVVAEPHNHMQSYVCQYSPALSKEIRVPLDSLEPMPLDERKVIARRAAFELPPNGIVNLGVGVPEGVAAVANEEKISQYITLTSEAGTVGGVLASGGNFGAGVNSDAIFDQNQMFDFYDGGGLDMACLGMAECDEMGNVNVSRFGPRLIGCGGFINISQNTRSMIFAGTFTAGGLKVAVADGKLQILQEGRARKFVKQVNQVTFSGDYAAKRGQPVYFVTERCVFQRGRKGLVLTEVAPGIDIEKDILAHMDFTPIVRDPILMDTRIFRAEPMGLEADLLNLDLADRISYDPTRNILFLNFEGMYVRVKADIISLRNLLEQRCKEIGKRVGVFVNYDTFRINENVADDLADMDRYMLEHYWTNITRYATSAFMRMKLDQAFSQRNIAPHVFERKEEAQAFLTSAK